MRTRTIAAAVLVAALAVTAASATALVSKIGTDAPATVASTEPAPTPVVYGNRLADSRSGATFAPHGVNWPSFEYSCSAKTGTAYSYSATGSTQAAADAMVSWHIDTVRIPLNQDCWLGANSGHNFGTSLGYQRAVKAWVGILRAHGIAVILDLHWNAPAGKIADGQYPMPDAQSLTFWKQVAIAYREDPSIIFDAFNEPYSSWTVAGKTYSYNLSWDCWQNGGCQVPDTPKDVAPDGGTYTAVGMTAIVAAIRSTGARQPIMLSGLNYSSDLTQWLAHKPADSQLVAGWHLYQVSGCVTVSCWTYSVGATATKVPVVTGEFGESDGGSQYMTRFMTWADSRKMGYLPWAWWDSSGGEAGLYALYTGNYVAKYPAGTTYKAHLLALSGGGL
jgi:endoglucanase